MWKMKVLERMFSVYGASGRLATEVATGLAPSLLMHGMVGNPIVYKPVTGVVEPRQKRHVRKY